MMLAAGKQVYLIDRMNEIRYCNIVLPTRADPQKRHDMTLLDGELVEDTVGDKLKLRYLVYDAVAINGIDVSRKNLLARLELAHKELIQPKQKQLTEQREAAAKTLTATDSAAQPSDSNSGTGVTKATSPPGEPFEIYIKV